MDNNSILLLAGVFSALVVGALGAWFAAKSRHASAMEAAVSKATADASVELAQLRERIRLSDEAKKSDQVQYVALRQELDTARKELDQARDEVARLTERASQLGDSQKKVQDLELQLRAKADELLRVSQEAAQTSQQVSSLTEQLTSSTTQANSLRLQLDAANTSLLEVSREASRLKEQAERVTPLEEELGAVRRQLEEVNAQLASVREAAAEETSRLQAELQGERDILARERRELASHKDSLASAQEQLATLQARLAELTAVMDGERASTQEKLALLKEARDSLTDQFKLVANQIFEEKSQKFSDQNKLTLGALLEPLKTQLTDFKSKVEEVYVQEGKDRSALAEQVRQLQTLNATLSQDAQNLTNALKGNAQTQGAWGELILETVLESSGLRKDEQYFVQDTQVREDGTKGRPDVVILLPQGRKLVVDSKVSLNAYEEYCSATDEDERSQALKRHMQSVRTHINGLSAREYQKMYVSLDFVLMFVPLEPAFMTAVAADKTLFMDAWNRNVLLVSPSTLLFVVRTVAHLWSQEAQSKNAQDIAKRGGALYDKLVEFAVDLQKLGTRLESAKTGYDEAFKRFSTGKGNIIWQAQTLKQLGVKASKSLPDALIDKAAPDLAAAEELAAIAMNNTPREGGVDQGTAV